MLPIGTSDIADVTVFELVVQDHVEYVDPKKYGISNESGVDPNKYFITSGDAVEKSKVLERDLWTYAGELRKKTFAKIAKEKSVDNIRAQQLYRSGVRPTSPKKWAQFESAVWQAAGQARKLINKLIKARGSAKFLETEWQDHILLCIPKNPRRP